MPSIDLGKLLICASAVSYINRDSSHPPKRMTEDYNELISQSFMPSLSLSLTHTQTHTHTHTQTHTHIHQWFAYNQFSSVVQSCPILCDSMDCSMPGFPVHHQLPEITQTHVHPVGDATQPSHPLLSPSLPVFIVSQHQGLFK